MPDVSPLYAAQRCRSPQPLGQSTEEGAADAIRRVNIVPIDRGDPRSFSTATTFGPPASRHTTGLTRIRSHDSTPNTSASDTSQELDFAAARRRFSSSASSVDNAPPQSRGRLRSIFGKSARPVYSRYLLDSACFSAAGDTLYLWRPRERKVAVLPISEHVLYTQARVRSCGSAHFLAGGTSKYMVVSQDYAPEGNIEVYANPKRNDVNEMQVDEGSESEDASFEPIPFQLGLPNDCFAIARNDKYIAWGTSNNVRIWDLQTRSPRDIQMPASRSDRSEVNSQRIAFTTDCESVVVATRFMNGHVSIRAWSLDGQATRSASMETELGITHDYGLSSVFADNELRVAVVTMMVSCVERILRSFTNPGDFVWPTARLQKKHFSYKIVSAAQSASGSKIALATSNDRIWALSLERRSIDVAEIANFSNERPAWLHMRNGTALACPDEDTVYAFWFDEARVKMTLAIITDGKLVCKDVRSCFGYS